MADESHTNNNSSSTNNLLHKKIRLKSTIPNLSNLTGTIIEVKRGGWFVTDNEEIGRPVRAKEFDVVDDDEKDDDEIKGPREEQQEEEQEQQEEEENSDMKDTKQPPHATNSNKKEQDTHSNNYNHDQFLPLGTTIQLTTGQHRGRICTISERRVGIFLKIAVGGDIRLMQPDEIEVLEFQKDVAAAAAAASTTTSKEEEKDDDMKNKKKKKEGGSSKNDTTIVKKKEKDFGHKKYIGASVRIKSATSAASTSPSSPTTRRGGRRKQQEQKEEAEASAIVENAFSGEWYLVSDPDISKALEPAQFEVVEDITGEEEEKKGGGMKRKRQRDDDSEEDEEEEEEEDDDDEEDDDEEEGEEDFLSSMQYCGEALPEEPKLKKSLRKREKRVNYTENGGESSDDMESWQDSEDEEKHDGKNDDDDDDEEDEVEEHEVENDDNQDGFDVLDEGEGGGDDDDDNEEDASVVSVKKPPAIKVAETSETPNGEQGNAKPNEDVQMTEAAAAAADPSDGDNGDNNKMEEEPATSAPILLHSKKADNNKVELLLSGMSHLPPDTEIEVFNRKTGLVMRGDEAILLKDLPAALLNHAEYEPIVPTPQSLTVGEANGDKEAVVENITSSLPADPNFDPWDNSVLVGVTVAVKSGPYRGITAKIKEVRGSRWVLDHEAVTTTLRSSDCLFIDDGNANKDAIAAHYGTKKKTPMPSFVKPGAVNIGRKRTPAAAPVRRVGRTDANVRVSNIILPQTRPPTRVRASAVEGKRVLVTGGEFRGLSGTISSCIPGGWYLVSNLYDDEHQLDVLIHSGKLELIDSGSSKAPPVQGHIHEQIKSSIHAKASELRMEKKRKDN